MLYALRTMSLHHLTCLQPCGMVCGELRERPEARVSPLTGVPERVERNSLKKSRAARATTTTMTDKNQEHTRERDHKPNFPGYPV